MKGNYAPRKVPFSRIGVKLRAESSCGNWKLRKRPSKRWKLMLLWKMIALGLVGCNVLGFCASTVQGSERLSFGSRCSYETDVEFDSLNSRTSNRYY